MLQSVEMWRHICLLALAVACVYTDLARGKLYNAVTLGGLALGFVFALVMDAGQPGWPHVAASAIGVALGGGVFLVIFLLGGLGAGDVKFMAAVGALAGDVKFTVTALVYSTIVGAILALGMLIMKGQLRQGLADSARALVRFRVPKRADDAPPPLTIPYGLAIGIGVIWAWVTLIADFGLRIAD